MLPSHWRIRVENATGVSIDAEIRYQGIGIDASSLAETFASWSGDLGFTGLADGSFDGSGDIDNSGDGYLAATVEVVVTASSTPSGLVLVRFERRGRDATDWPEDGEKASILTFNLSSTGTFRKTAQVS